MRFARFTEVKDGLSEYLARARKRRQPAEHDLEDLVWKRLGTRRLEREWEREKDALYDYL